MCGSRLHCCQLDESSAELDIFVRDSLEKAHALLAAAKETALARYVLTDDITALKEELVSVASQESLGEPSTTLLEDLDALHEKLGQLEQARTYVRIVERGVQLRYVPHPPELSCFSVRSCIHYHGAYCVQRSCDR